MEDTIISMTLALALSVYVNVLVLFHLCRSTTPKSTPPREDIPTAEPADEIEEPWEQDADWWKQ